MKTETSSRPIPKTYRLCVKTDCPRAAECLRCIALAFVSPDEQSIQVINPAYLSTIEGDCPVFRSAEKVRYARGFVKMLSGLTVKQAHAFRIALESDFGHTRYFRLRAGERLIDPPTQKHIRQVMTRIGIAPLPDFDDYVEEYAW
jgi:hypothetical protein